MIHSCKALEKHPHESREVAFVVTANGPVSAKSFSTPVCSAARAESSIHAGISSSRTSQKYSGMLHERKAELLPRL